MRHVKNQKGQSLVEFAVVVPLLLLVIMGIVEFGIMLNSYLAINNAAREGARTGIIGSSDIEIQTTVTNTSPALKTEDLIITVVPAEGSRKPGDTLTVNINYNYHLTIPIISSIFNNSVVLKAQTSMRME